MSFKRPFSVSPPSQQLDGDTPESKTKDSSESNICRICGDQARIINYGTLSCQSCRTFFRRNGFRPEVCIEEYFHLISLPIIYCSLDVHVSSIDHVR
jgi:hypothetical protein